MGKPIDPQCVLSSQNSLHIADSTQIGYAQIIQLESIAYTCMPIVSP